MTTRGIKLVQFGALTAQDWKAFAIEINTASNRGSTETTGTPHDERLGALANGVVCVVCGEKNNKCPGHWGYIPLEEPCYNPEYIEIVVGIFKCICHKCINPRISESVAGPILSQRRALRFKAYKKKAETIKQCSVCSEILPNFFPDKYGMKMFYGDRADAVPVTAREACAILMQVTSETMKLLGFNDDLSQNSHYVLPQDKIHVHEVRPEAFIFEVLPLLPTCSRPWVIKGNDRKDDDLTDKYNSILKINSRLKADREAPLNAQPIKGRKKTGKLSEVDKKKAIEDLNSGVWSLLDNSGEKGKNNNRQHKGIRERLGTKEGHIQSNVAGKRCDYAARSVIVGGGNMVRMEEIGVPGYIAKTITVPELVVEWNIKSLEILLANGKINTICRQGFTIDVSEVTAKNTKPFIWKEKPGLQIFDIVHRQFRTGDWGLFNRQPTLRLESMQGVRCVVFEDELVFRVPLGVTRPYNADFDGDEMNLHAPQSQGARVECSTICRTWFHMVSAQNNAPVMGAVQNTLLCFYYITETFSTPEEVHPEAPNYKFADGTDGYQTMVDLSDFMDACMTADINFDRLSDLVVRVAKYYPDYVYEDENGYLRFADKLPGKIVASIVFPRTFSWSRKTDINERLPVVQIQDGVILPDSGPLCKKSIGGVSGSAIHPLWKGLNGVSPSEGPKQAADLVSELQFMMTILMPRIGFSMGISDCLPTDEALEMVERTIKDVEVKCEIVSASDKTPEDKENEINGILNEAMSVAPKLAKTGMNKKDRNSLVIMKKSGAKGSDTNNGQIAGFVGQQNLNGARIPYSLSNETRTLSHFLPHDSSPAARGFVGNSYLKGLNYKEQWFHATGGRRGVIDTALKTSDSGYIQKKIVNAISDFKVWHDMTTRNANGSVIQFAYGSDGMNAKELMNTKGLDYPFFMNCVVTADCFNSEAEQDPSYDEEGSIGRGALRKLTKEETNILVANAINSGMPGCQTGVTEMITYNMKCATRAAVADIKLYECMIPKFCKKVKDEYEHAKAKNGYMAGLVASCSIGEPTTQLTLNSVDWKSVVCVKIDGDDKTGLSEGGAFLGPIGEFIDTAIEKSDVVTKFTENDTEYVDIFDYKAEVVCVDERGKMHWKRLEAVTRHLPGGKMVKIKTRMGREVVVTRSKSLLVRENNLIVEKAGSAMKVGDYVPVVIDAPTVENPVSSIDVSGVDVELDREVGFSFGYYAIFRKLDEEHSHPAWSFKLGLDISTVLMEQCLSKKGIPSWSCVCIMEFVHGFLDAMFSYRSKITERNEIECECGTIEMAEGIVDMCSRISVFAKLSGSNVIIFSGFAKKFVRTISLTNIELRYLYEEKAGTKYLGDHFYMNGGSYDFIPGIKTSNKNYNGKIHRDYIKNAIKYDHNVISNEDLSILVEAAESQVFFDEVISVEEVESTANKVYDFTVVDTRNFTIFGGLCVRDTFHNAGNSAKDVTLGVPRFQEILNASGRPTKAGKPSKAGCTIYLKNDQMSSYMLEKTELKKKNDEPEARAVRVAEIESESLYLMAEIASPLACLYVSDIMTDYELQYLPTEDGKPRDASPLGLITYETYEAKWWVTLRENLGMSPSFSADAWVILLKLDTYKLYQHGITVEDVAVQIEENSFGSKGYALACVPSPNTLGQIEVYLNFTEIEEHTRSQVDMPLGEKVSRYLVSPKNIEYYAIREVALDLIRKTQIQGINGITKTYVRQNTDGEWLIDTRGTNLMTILGLPGVDATRTTSDSMWEIYNVLGIEATRKFLIREITKILSFDGTYINPRHICLLVDGMIRQGTINSVNRDGIPRDVGPIAKGMFETAVDNFAEAAAFAEHDKMRGVAAAVMFGTLAEVGTGMVEIKDAEKLPISIRKTHEIVNKQAEIPKRAPLKIPLKPRK